MSPPERPSVPHSLSRVPTGPRPTVPKSPPEAQDAEHDPMTMAIAEKIANGAFTVEDLLTLNRIVSRNTVVETRNDDKMRVDASVSLLDSKLDGALTRIVNASQQVASKWKAIAALATTMAVTMGAVTASCANAYQTARLDAVEPAARAEQKAERADAQIQQLSSALEKRILASEERHAKTETKLEEIETSINTANSVLLKISEKLDVPPESGKKKSNR